MKAPHYRQVLDFAEAELHSLCPERVQAARRFLGDIENRKYDFRPELAEFCIAYIEQTFCHAQGEALDGTPMRGTPFRLMPWHLFVTYNLCGFFLPGTDILRYTEGLIFTPRKQAKTTFATALLWALTVYYRRSGAKCKTVAGSLKQSMESFQFLSYNLHRLGVTVDERPGGLRVLDSSLGHSFEGVFGDGFISWEALAYKPELFDSFNAPFALLDELHVYRDGRPYARLKEASKAYTHKLLLAPTTAGDDALGFCAQHVAYACRILDGSYSGPDAERFFAYVCKAPVGEDGEIDFRSPAVHAAASPAWGITIRPEDMAAEAASAGADPLKRKDFYTRSLNVFVGQAKAYFDVEVFRRSDRQYRWTEAEARELCRHWYGGADLSKLHDLTAGALVGEIGDVLCILPHCWFPVTAAVVKSDEDHIPLFGWTDDGWLDMSNDAAVNHAEIVEWFKAKRRERFRIRQVGHDRKFCGEYFTAMKAAGFTCVDQPQLYLKKSRGFRYIENKALNGKLYYFGAEPFEYCVGNVHAIEKVDDAVQYEKIRPNTRIDVFDAAVFAVVRMLEDRDKRSEGARWFADGEE